MLNFNESLDRFEFLLAQLISINNSNDNYIPNETIAVSLALNINELSRIGLWKTFWNKPFYRGIKVAIADKWIKSIENLLGNPNSDEGINFFSNIEAQFKSNKKSWNSPENYEFSGKNASKIFNLNPNFPKDRLYQVCKFAKRMQLDSDRLVENIKKLYIEFCADCNSNDANIHFQEVLSFFVEKGWGCITILHGLTDLGYSVKPDIHFVRAHKFLSVPTYSSELKDPTCRKALSIANYYVYNSILNLGDIKKIIQKVAPTDYEKLISQNRLEEERVFLRYLDKVIMDFSFQNIVLNSKTFSSLIDLNKDNIALNSNNMDSYKKSY